jgi:peptidyl-prolyl cis-trans isomerase D
MGTQLVTSNYWTLCNDCNNCNPYNNCFSVTVLYNNIVPSRPQRQAAGTFSKMVRPFFGVWLNYKSRHAPIKNGRTLKQECSMALIGKIRKNPLIVLLFIGGGIALFIFSEMTNGAAGGAVGPLDKAMARIGEREIDRNDFERTLSGAFSGGDAYQNRDQLFNFFVNESLVNNEADALGVTISEEEETQMLFGATPSSAVMQLMQNRQTGQVDRAMLSRIQGFVEAGTLKEAAQDPVNQLNQNLPAIWDYTTRQAKANRLQEKMNAMVSKAMYAPKWQAQKFADQQLQNRRVAVVKVPFDKLDDGAVTVSDADLQDFITENESVFTNPEESRTLSYITFNVLPTAGDSAHIRGIMNDISADWQTETSAEGDSLFAIANRGTYSPNYFAASTVSDVISDVVMNEMEIGSIYGPYVEGTDMKLVKLLDRKVMADSVSMRMITRSAFGADQVAKATTLIDSLKTVLQRSSSKWSSIADEFSQDFGSKANGGKITGVKPGQRQRPIDQILFHTGKVGSLYTVTTPSGVSLIEVTKRSSSTSTRAKLAFVTENIVPQSETEDEVLAKAQSFLNGKNTLAEVRSAAEAAGMEVSTSNPLAQSNYALANLGSGQEVRDIMCFAFGADKGEVSGIVYTFTDPQLFYENNYVVVGVEAIVPKGVTPVSAIKEVLTPTVLNRKKGEQIATSLGNMDLASIAAKYDVEVDTVSSNLTLGSLPGIGREPKVLAAAAAVATGSVSAPIVGNDGVYVLVPLTDASDATSGNLPGARQQINLTARQQVIGSLLPALRSASNIEDSRSDIDCQGR